jgi:MipA family protein
MKQNIAVIAILASLFPASTALAQENLSSGKEWKFNVGGGIMVAPKYMGDDSYGLYAVPSVSITYKDKFFASVEEGVGYNYLINDNWRIGPVARYDFGRDEDGDSIFRIGGDTDDLRGLGDVDGTVELGAFVEYKMDALKFSFDVLQGIGGHESLRGSAEASYNGMTNFYGQPIAYSFGPELQWAGSDYHNAYFGVNSAQSAASGLSQYKADGGFLSYGLGGNMMMPLNERITAITFAKYNHLGDEAANSSLVEERGSEHQGIFGAFITYGF